ncbi:hypothetical protein [Pseudomonas syringae]|uniref:hypothetical protein n=1 Tax=Pseudomonas syringae TaxID=317 RepID=UPI0002099254|nr:hypothetical protein [Pseudomonas syringae]EGH72844.1 hypothetical protein PSYAR_20021 [Pseudomonas syringae pv. aceris str. M302273]
MFNLEEALRSHLARHRNHPESTFVAASVATLSQRSKPDRARVVAGVAGVARVARVATTGTSRANAKTIIQRLEEEGASLYAKESTLCVRPSDWAQLAVVSQHWQMLLLHLAEKEVTNEPGR